jgi:GPH family glycoside/pentoside/hexuronide:cation symporter
MEPEQNESPRPERTPLSVKLWFGAPAFGAAALSVPIAVHVAQFYSDTALIPLGYLAVAIAISRSLDALSDPFVGWLTDRTRTRWGRRKPYILMGAPLCGIVFWALFTPPESLGAVQASLWFGVTLCLFLIFLKLYTVPHAALGAEISLDYHERSSLFGIQTIFIQLGIVAAASLPAILIGTLGAGSERRAFSLMAAALAAIFVVLCGFLLWFVPERREFVERASNPLVPGVRRALRNRAFRIIFLFTLIQAVPSLIPAVLIRYYTFYVIRPESPETWFGIFLAVLFISGTAAIPLWMAAARRYGKLRTFVTAYGLGLFGNLAFFFAGEGDVVYVTVVCGVVGLQTAAGSFLLPAMGADAIDYEELLSGRRREAQFGALWTMLPKFVAIPGNAIPIAILAVVGYVPNQAQTSEVLFAIRFMLGILPVAFYAVALVALLRYPISEAVHARIRAGIEAHARGESADDPVTGATLPPASEREVEEQTGWFLDHFSPGELRRSLRKGNANLLRDVLRAGGLALGVFVAASWLAFRRISSVEVEPGVVAVLAVVVAGLALAALLFHALRIRPARRMGEAPVSPDVVRTHLGAGAAA